MILKTENIRTAFSDFIAIVGLKGGGRHNNDWALLFLIQRFKGGNRSTGLTGSETVVHKHTAIRARALHVVANKGLIRERFHFFLARRHSFGARIGIRNRRHVLEFVAPIRLNDKLFEKPAI